MGANSKLTFTCTHCGKEEELDQASIMEVVQHPSTVLLVESLGGRAQQPTRTRGNIALEQDEDGKLVARRIIGQVETK